GGQARNRRGADSRNLQTWTDGLQTRAESLDDGRRAAIEIDRQIRPGRFFADTDHETRTVDPVLESQSMQCVEGPADRLTVGHHEVECIHPEQVFRIASRRQKPMNRHRRRQAPLLIARRAHNAVYPNLVIGPVNVYAEAVMLVPAEPAVACRSVHPSRPCSKISCRIIGTSYRWRHSGKCAVAFRVSVNPHIWSPTRLSATFVHLTGRPGI